MKSFGFTATVPFVLLGFFLLYALTTGTRITCFPFLLFRIMMVGNVETLNCYYAHGEHNHCFQRRSYWMLDPAYEHIVLVHYREINEAKHSSASIVWSPVSSSAFSPSPNSYNSQNPGSNSLACDVHQTHQKLSSPGSVEVSSDIVIKHNEIDNSLEYTIPADLQVSQALKRLEEQLSLNEDSFKDSSASIVRSPVSSSTFSPSPNSYTSQNRGSNSLASDVHETYQNLSSPGSVEVSSDIFMKNNGIDNTVEYICPADLQVSHALKRLEEQLSLNEDSFKEMSPFCRLDGDTDNSKFLEYGRRLPSRTHKKIYCMNQMISFKITFILNLLEENYDLIRVHSLTL